MATPKYDMTNGWKNSVAMPEPMYHKLRKAYDYVIWVIDDSEREAREYVQAYRDVDEFRFRFKDDHAFGQWLETIRKNRFNAAVKKYDEAAREYGDAAPTYGEMCCYVQYGFTSD